MKHGSNLTPAWLDEATGDDVAKLSPDALDMLRILLDADMDVIKRRQARLEAGVALRYCERAHAGFAPKGGVGTIHLDDDDYDVTVEASKTVMWDEDKLVSILNAMPPEDAKHYAKVKVTVGEREFTAAPPAIQKLLQEARTVKPGKWKFTFKRREAGQEAA